MKPIWMLDVETTGLDIAKNQITSVALVAFDDVAIRAGVTKVLDKLACRLILVPWRHDDQETIDWRNEHGVPMYEEALQVLNYQTFADTLRTRMLALSPEPTIMAKPTFFDVSFLCLVLQEMKCDIPWHYHNVRDLATRVEEIGFNLNKEVEPEVRKYWKHPAHAALDDCHFQIECLRMAYMMRQVQNREEEHF